MPQDDEAEFEDMFSKFQADDQTDPTDKIAEQKSERLRSSMKKVNLRSSEKEVRVKTFAGLKKTNSKDGNIDLEEQKEKNRFISTMVQARQIQQQRFLSKIRSNFNPLRILQKDRKLVIHREDSQSRKEEVFDAIWVFEIIGRKYEQIENPLKLGVFDSAKCYYVVFRQGNKVSIVLWRGKNQNMLSFQSSIDMFMETKFRDVSNTQRGKGQQLRSASTVESFSKLLKNDQFAGMIREQNPGLIETRQRNDTIA